MEAPSASKKFRALQQALNLPLETVAREYAAKPDTYQEIAAEWTARVRLAFPGKQLPPYTLKDVWRLFDQHGVARVGRQKSRRVVTA